MGGDAFDMVLYLFVLGPAVEWCLKSKRVNGSRPGSRRGIGLAVALLAAVAAVRLSADIWGRPENAFSILGLRVDASTSEIKQAYRKRVRVSLTLTLTLTLNLTLTLTLTRCRMTAAGTPRGRTRRLRTRCSAGRRSRTRPPSGPRAASLSPTRRRRCA